MDVAYILLDGGFELNIQAKVVFTLLCEHVKTDVIYF